MRDGVYRQPKTKDVNTDRPNPIAVGLIEAFH